MTASPRMVLFQFQIAILAGQVHGRFPWKVAEELSVEHLHAEDNQ